MNIDKLKRKKRKFLEENNEIKLISTCSDLASIYLEKEQYEDAIEEYEIIANIYRKQKKDLEYGTVHRGIGEAYLGLDNFEKALQHQKIHLEIAEKLQNKLEQQRALATIGHTYLTSYLEAPDKDNKKSLDLAKNYFTKSLMICDRLSGEISKLQSADMSARLYSNLGLVEDALGHRDRALELVNKSINLCRCFDIYEQLIRGYLSLASLYEKNSDNKLAIQQCSLAVEVAKKVKDHPGLLSTALVNKADLLIKLGEFQAAKTIYYKAYKIKIPNEKDHNQITKNLKIVALLCRYQDRLLSTDQTNFKDRKNLYEKIADNLCELKSLTQAIDYYKQALDVAMKLGLKGSDLGALYYSIAECYKDNAQYDEAVENYEKELQNFNVYKLGDQLNTLSRIADTKETADCPVNEVRDIYLRAIKMCRNEGNQHEEGRMLKRCIGYLRRKKFNLEADQMQCDFDRLNYESSDGESDYSQPQNAVISPSDEIDIEEITDVSGDSDSDEATLRRKKRKNYVIKRNAKGETDLHKACIKGNLNVVMNLINQGHPVNIRDRCGWLPLHEACNYGYKDVVKFLLEKGAAINDRGGDDCRGVTPLHDAATNGHLDIVELLLDKGANAVAKTDDGQTVLDFLNDWRTRADLDFESENKFQQLWRRVSSALDKSGLAKPKQSPQSKSKAFIHEPDAFNEPILTARRTKRTTADFESPIKSLEEPSPSSSYMVDSRRSRNVGLDLDEPLIGGSSLEGTSGDYRNVIENLRHKRPGLAQAKSPVSSRKSVNPKKPALLTADYQRIDDWLEDDLAPNSRKRKTSSSPVQSKTTKSRRSSRTSGEIVWLSDDEVAPLQELSDNNSRDSVISRASSRRMTQTTLDFPIRSPAKTPTKSPVTLINRHQQSLNFPKNDSFDSLLAQIDPTLSVDVRIEGKLYKVPILLSQINTHTIKWLAEEAANRYAKREYVKPTLELETAGGALLADDDQINILFPMGNMQSEEVRAVIVKREIPPLWERYQEACHDLCYDPDTDLVATLQTASGILDLSNRCLENATLSPLCKALNRQNDLYELNLTGNYLSFDCIKFLANSLNSLENLTKLCLNCTGLTTEHLEILTKDLVTLKINYLDLSDNFLSDQSWPLLVSITHFLKLQHLNLSMNKFSGPCNFPGELKFDLLQSLDISDNQFDNRAITGLVSKLDFGVLKSLNLSNNCTTPGLLGELLLMFGRDLEKRPNLENVKLSRCSVTDIELIDLLLLMKSLSVLDVSYNPSLTCLGLRHVLQQKLLVDVDLCGCDNIFKYFDFDIPLERSLRKLKIGSDLRHYQLDPELLKNWYQANN